MIRDRGIGCVGSLTGISGGLARNVRFFGRGRCCYSKSALLRPDCRMMDRRVPVRISLWSGTGTVLVAFPSFFCMTMWLPRRRTSTKPRPARIAQTSLPERTGSLGKRRNLYARDEDLILETLLDFLLGGTFQEEGHSLFEVRFACSIVSPWLAMSNSGHRATYRPFSPFSMMAVSCRLIAFSRLLAAER